MHQKPTRELNPGGDQNGLLLKFWKLLNLDNFIKRKRNWHRQLVKILVNKAKCDYYETLVKNAKNKSASIWKCIVSLSNKKSSNMPSTMHVGGNTLTDSKDIARNLNNFFIISTKTARDDMPLCGTSRKTTLFQKTIQEFVAGKIGISDLFKIPQVSEMYVCKQLKSLNIHKAIGTDDIGPYFFKLAAEIISPSLTYILNRSIKCGTLRTLWSNCYRTATASELI